MRLLSALLCACAVLVWMTPSRTSRLERILVAGSSPPIKAALTAGGASESPAAQAPLVADLLSAALEAGLPVSAATAVVHTALAGRTREEVGRVVRSYDIGASAEEAWSQLPRDSSLAPIAHAVVRSYDSGAALSPALRACAAASAWRRRHLP